MEIARGNSGLLGAEGLLGVLRDLEYPAPDLDTLAAERQLLACSNRIRFDDDLTIVEIRLQLRSSRTQQDVPCTN